MFTPHGRNKCIERGFFSPTILRASPRNLAHAFTALPFSSTEPVPYSRRNIQACERHAVSEQGVPLHMQDKSRYERTTRSCPSSVTRSMTWKEPTTSALSRNPCAGYKCSAYVAAVPARYQSKLKCPQLTASPVSASCAAPSLSCVRLACSTWTALCGEEMAPERTSLR